MASRKGKEIMETVECISKEALMLSLEQPGEEGEVGADYIEKSVVGKVISKRSIFKGLLRNVLYQKWRSFRGWNMAEVEPNIYTIRFQKKLEAEMVVERSPWPVCGGHLILKPLAADGRWNSTDLNVVPIWVRVYDVPPRFFTKKNATTIANRIGGVISIDRMWKNGFPTAEYIRLRANIHLKKPLLVGLNLPMDEGVSLWCYFKYENLPRVCFKCGLVGHEEVNCNRRRRVISDDLNHTVPMYGPWMRFGSRLKHCFEGVLAEELAKELEGVHLGSMVTNIGEVEAPLAEDIISQRDTGVAGGHETALEFEPGLMGTVIHQEYLEGNAGTTVAGEMEPMGLSLEGQVASTEKGTDGMVDVEAMHTGATDGTKNVCREAETGVGGPTESQIGHLAMVFKGVLDPTNGSNSKLARHDCKKINRRDITGLLKPSGKPLLGPCPGKKRRLDDREGEPFNLDQAFSLRLDGMGLNPKKNCVEVAFESKEVVTDGEETVNQAPGEEKGDGKLNSNVNSLEVDNSGKENGDEPDFSQAEEAGHYMPPIVNPDLVFLMETKRNNVDMEGIWQQLGFLDGLAVSSIGASGGLALFWKAGWDVQILHSSVDKIIIRCGADRNFKPWVGCFIYAPPKRSERDSFWASMSTNMHLYGEAWMVMGDMNAVLCQEEKIGGRPVCDGEGRGLRNFIFDNGAVELGGSGVMFTWTNGQDWNKLIKEKLDRVLCLTSWLSQFPKAGTKNLPIRHSDHSAIILNTVMETERFKAPFRYIDAWNMDEGCSRVVNEAWQQVVYGFQSYILCTKLRNTATALCKWNVECFGHCKKKLDFLEKVLTEIQNKSPSAENLQLESAVMLEIDEIEARQEAIWKQKSRELWLRDEDRNSRFFHASLIIRRKKNFIWAVSEDGVHWMENRAQVVDYFRSNFIESFKSSNPVIGEEVFSLVSPSILPSENVMMSAIPTMEEIKAVVWDMPALKSPGPDGFPAKFYRTHWETVGAQTVKFVQEFFTSGSFTKEVNRTFLVLIPKKKEAYKFDDYRPISLCNVCYKIIAKILANRLRKVLDKIISPYQSTFVKGRWIAENSIIAHEIVHDMGKRQGRQAFIGIKCDMSKAYDRLEWGFVKTVLKAFGFSDWVSGLIMECITTVTFQVLVNGGLTKAFTPSRGLRQGDPLSPYLFILCSEILSRMVLEKERLGELTGYCVSNNSPSVSHLMYADDTIFFTKADSQEVDTLAEVLDRYCYWSGQRINVSKSKILLSKNCDTAVGEAIAEALGFNIMQGDETFLGNPLFVSGNRRQDFQFIIDNVRNRMDGWRAKLLSQAARTVLIKNVISAIPIYSMSIFLLPKTITDSLDALARRFWWTGSVREGRFLALRSWESICRPKSCGRLGIRKFQDINFCLIAKLAWFLVSNHQSLLCRIFLGKYWYYHSNWSGGLGSGASPVVRGIWKTREFIRRQSLWIMGRFSNVEFWYCSWTCADGVIFGPQDLNPGVVSEEKLGWLRSDDEVWDAGRIERLFRPEAATSLSSCNINELSPFDSLIWHTSPTGTFSLKQAYWDLNSHRFGKDKTCLALWKLPIHERLKLFLWKIMTDCLPFGSRLSYIFGNNVGNCILCDSTGNDTSSHFLLHCPITQSLWRSSKWAIQPSDFPLHSGAEVITWMLFPQSFGGLVSENDKEEFLMFVAVMYHNLWFFRNDKYHNHTIWTLDEMKRKIDREFVQHRGSKQRSEPHRMDPPGIIAIRWLIPRPGRIRAHVDFANKDGIGAVGVVIRDESGHILAMYASKTQFLSIIHGELWAVYWGLKVMIRLGCAAMDIISDCQVLVVVFLKNIAPHWNISRLFALVKSLLVSFDVSLLWAPR
uniref:Reverse transcriptase domain-containing protein n=1 Tax=Cannabis sativa TaxID=3483 RepID=A0A803NNJ0_CANSA